MGRTDTVPDPLPDLPDPISLSQASSGATLERQGGDPPMSIVAVLRARTARVATTRVGDRARRLLSKLYLGRINVVASGCPGTTLWDGAGLAHHIGARGG